MEANGLMVGNYLKKDGVVVRIDARSIFDMFNDNPRYELIPITQEWLLKFGFIKRNEYEFDFWQNSMWKLKEYKNKKYYILFHCSDEVDCTLIKYVHSLQNLYFALTGEDLQIKA